MRELSPNTKRHYAEEIRIYRSLKSRIEVEEHLKKLKPSTRAHRIIVWNKYCKARLNLPFEKLYFDPKCIPHDQLDRFKIYVNHNCTDDQKLFIDLGLRLGLRLAEILNIKSESIRDRGVAVMRKGGKTQIMPCPDDILDRIKTNGGVKWGRGYYQTFMIRISKELGIKISAHSLRHTFATEAVRENCNIHVLKEAMGHTNLNTTAKYVSISPEQLRSIIK